MKSDYRGLGEYLEKARTSFMPPMWITLFLATFHQKQRKLRFKNIDEELTDTERVELGVVFFLIIIQPRSTKSKKDTMAKVAYCRKTFISAEAQACVKMVLQA